MKTDINIKNISLEWYKLNLNRIEFIIISTVNQYKNERNQLSVNMLKFVLVVSEN